ncbi:MAG: hydroxysqualene dehydroxylase HpnE [Phycisphaerae bacterium]
MSESKPHVIVVGGGLAGIACAVATAGRARVTLLESRFALGGRAGSFEDGERAGELLDNCQHVLLGCCTNLIDLYRRLGVSEKVRFHRSVHFLDAHGKRHNLWAVAGMPAPLHLGPAFGMFSALTLGERSAVARAMLEMLRIGKSGRDQLEGVAFGDWLDRMKQPAGLVHKFYDPVLISALNEETRKVSAKYAIQVFQDAMLAHKNGFIVGLPACPLGELYANVPGVDLRLNTRVDEVLFEGRRAVGVRLRSGEELRGDAVVLATNHHAVQRWIPDELKQRDVRFAGLHQLESVPILGAHLWFDRPIMTEEAAALIEGPLQWLFRKDAEGRVLHGVISAAREWTAVPKEEALRQFEAQVRSLFPAAREATLERGVIVIEKRATFSPLPGTDRLRPWQAPPADGIENLYLAGDYTKTDWPATMEGAVRSGYLAAEAVLHQPQVRVADLPIQWPARLMGLAK